ncbi:MAG TPA: GNAT family N-acetyltransferase [Thermoanaerobaculia bacterium]|nr:GNAT family N-acetyltransferase [Thermoanaerobaculia bacterium]
MTGAKAAVTGVAAEESAEARRVALRPAEPADRELLFRVYASTREEELAPVPWPPETKEAFLRQQFDAQDAWWRANYDGASFEVVVADGRDVGRLYLWEGPSEVRIVDVALLPQARRGGIGTSLVRDVQARASAAGKSVTIHVERMNPALRLYERLGFRLVEDKGVYLFLSWSGDAVS